MVCVKPLQFIEQAVKHIKKQETSPPDEQELKLFISAYQLRECDNTDNMLDLNQEGFSSSNFLPKLFVDFHGFLPERACIRLLEVFGDVWPMAISQGIMTMQSEAGSMVYAAFYIPKQEPFTVLILCDFYHARVEFRIRSV